MRRRHMTASLPGVVKPGPRTVDLPARHPVPDDAEALATLMLAAYRGTIDADGSETLDDARGEVASYFGGRSGAPHLEESWVAVSGDAVVSAVLVSCFEDVPLIAYAMTDPAFKGRGLATWLTERAMRSLVDAGETEVQLWVTAGNPAERIYERLGFREVGR
jgi:ribosomal protein S18 acetylase RimI-like enzyme